MQLADELPMLALVLHTSYVLWCRPSHATNRVERPLLFCSLFLFLIVSTSVLLTTHRSQAIHSFFRGCVTYAFSAAFLYIFVAQSAAAADLDKRFPTTFNFFSDIFSKGFCCFMIAIFGWIAENLGCSVLQSLPFHLPFPHFHGILWHLGCAAGNFRFIFCTNVSSVHTLFFSTPTGLHYLLLITIVCNCDDQEKAARAVKVRFLADIFIAVHLDLCYVG
jgi:hypothetical protein